MVSPHVCKHTDDDGRHLAPLVAVCGTCGGSWCDRCDPCPSALCPWCHGYGSSTAEISPPNKPEPKAPRPRHSRSHRVEIRLSDRDRHALEVAAALEGAPLATWVRTTCLRAARRIARRAAGS